MIFFLLAASSTSLRSDWIKAVSPSQTIAVHLDTFKNSHQAKLLSHPSLYKSPFQSDRAQFAMTCDPVSSQATLFNCVQMASLLSYMKGRAGVMAVFCWRILMRSEGFMSIPFGVFG